MPKFTIISLLSFLTLLVGCENNNAPASAEQDENMAAKRKFEATLKLAQKGQAAAMHDLGFYYSEGHGVDQNASLAFEWWQKGAELANAASYHKLGRAYSRGIGTEVDAEKSTHYYKLSAEAGYPDSFVDLGYRYLFGKGTKLNRKKAVQYFKKASDQNISRGHYWLADCYKNGLGVNRDLTLAAQLYEKSFLGGEKGASLSLLSIFREIKDYESALKWDLIHNDANIEKINLGYYNSLRKFSQREIDSVVSSAQNLLETVQ